MSYLDINKNKIFKKYTTSELLKDIDNYKNKSGNLNKVLNHFFEECIFKCCGKKTKISPYEVLQDDDKMSIIIDYINSKPKFFTSKDEVSNVKSCFRNSMSWVRKVANFPCRTAKDIYLKYIPKEYIESGKQINCLDTSMGFGSRMSAVLLSGNNYFGFDPNTELFNKLQEYLKFLFDNGVINKNQQCKMYCCGSEIHKPELDNTIDISFTSPPYFNLEKYSNDASESTLNYNNYRAWVDKFVIPTVNNTYKYLKIGGYAMINIKDINKKETCYQDFMNAFNSIDGFEYIETFDLVISKKQYGMLYNNVKGVINNTEPVMVFKKVR